MNITNSSMVPYNIYPVGILQTVLWEFPPSPIQQSWIYCQDLMTTWSPPLPFQQRRVAVYYTYTGKSMVRVCWKNAHFTLATAQRPTHALLPVYYPPTPSHPHIQQPIVECHVFPFLIQFWGKFKKEINTFREEWHCSISTMIHVKYIFTLCICCVAVHWMLVQHPYAAASCSSILHSRWPQLLVRRKHKRWDDTLRHQPINLFQEASIPFINQ